MNRTTIRRIVDWCEYDILKPVVVLVLSEIIGNILHEIILHFEHGEDATVYPLGTVMTLIVVLGIMLYAAAVEDSARFNTYISLGCTRKEYFAGKMLEKIVIIAVGILLSYISYKYEIWKFRTYYAGIENELDMSSFYTLKIIIPFVLVTLAIAFTASSMCIKYGTKAMWVLYGIFMFCFICVPRLIDRYIDNIRLSVASLSMDIVVIIAVVLSVISVIVICVDRCVMMRQAVN